MSDVSVLCFQGAGTAIHAESLLSRSALDARLAPVPSRVTSPCGVVVVLPWKGTPRMQGALGLLRQAGIEYAAAHHLEIHDAKELTW